MLDLAAAKTIAWIFAAIGHLPEAAAPPSDDTSFLLLDKPWRPARVTIGRPH